MLFRHGHSASLHPAVKPRPHRLDPQSCLSCSEVASREGLSTGSGKRFFDRDALQSATTAPTTAATADDAATTFVDFQSIIPCKAIAKNTNR